MREAKELGVQAMLTKAGAGVEELLDCVKRELSPVDDADLEPAPGQRQVTS